VGGLKEKALAAVRAGIETVIIPRLNERDLVEIPAALRRKVSFVSVESMAEVLAAALERDP
jgi:ATP-dependent Lon protease